MYIIPEKRGLPLRTLAQVRADLLQAKRNKCEAAMARLMLNHGRLTCEARLYLALEYPQ